MKMTKKSFFDKYAMLLVLVILMVAFGCASPVFFTAQNIFNVLRQVSIMGICAVGMAMVIITGGIDLSVGSLIAVAGITMAMLMVAGVNAWLAAVTAVAVGAAVGFVNAFFINRFDLPPFVATLGAMTALRGTAYLMTGGFPIYGFPDSFLILGQGYVGPVPVPVMILALAFLLGYVILEKTKFGRSVYGVGGNEEASRLSGIDPKRVRYKVYILNGMLIAVAGIIFVSRMNSVQAVAGTGYELDIITAVILGGVAMTGGQGRILGVLVGVVLLGVLLNGMTLLNVNEYMQMVVKGLLLLGAVTMDKVTKRSAT